MHVEELVLVDARAYTGPAYPDLSSAWQVLSLWRKALRSNAIRLLSGVRPGEEAAVSAVNEDAPEAFWDPDWDEAGRLAAWKDVLRATSRHPPLLAAAIAWDSWHEILPDQRGPWKAGLLAALVLKMRGKTRYCLLPIDTGQRYSPYRRKAGDRLEARLSGFLEWSVTAAERGQRDLDRLSVAEGLLRGALKGRRRNSKLPGLVDLLLTHPVVSVPMAAKALKCSNQAVEVMLKDLRGIAHEVTGRQRYRAWTVV